MNLYCVHKMEIQIRDDHFLYIYIYLSIHKARKRDFNIYLNDSK